MNVVFLNADFDTFLRNQGFFNTYNDKSKFINKIIIQKMRQTNAANTIRVLTINFIKRKI